MESLHKAAAAGTLIAERYRIERLIADGGMATVFLATDLKHSRKVAVKILHESLAHTIGIQRFLREIDVIARLQHPHLLTLIDSGTISGFPYYVMPYVEALSLRETIAERGKLAHTDAIRIALEIADGLAYAHANGVVHRDIKPSNILMSDGHAVVSDFGIATAIQNSTTHRITVSGSSLGSPTYMSPEQAAGEGDVDARSDVYSLACVVFEMLTGRPPVDHVSMQQMITRKLTGNYSRLRELRPDLPTSLEAHIGKALSPDRSERFGSVEEFANALRTSLPTARGLSTRARWGIAAVALLAFGGSVAFVRHQRAVVWATRQVPEINSFVQVGKSHAAFELAESVLPILPDDSTLNALRPIFTDFLNVVTVPSGARVSIQRLGDSTKAWKYVGTTPIESLPMPRLIHELGYRMRIERTGYETVDLLANLFVDFRALGGGAPLDTLFLDPAGSHPGMVRVRGFSVTIGGQRLSAGDFHIGRFEVTNKEYKRFVDAGGYSNPEYWTEPMVSDGKAITWEDGIAILKDRSGQPGPSTWSRGTYPQGDNDLPVGGLSFYEAAAYARFAGMQLPTSEHWFRAALRNAREAQWLYIGTSNINGSGPRKVGLGTMTVWGLYDVTGNVREWCVNPIGAGRLTRGASWLDMPFNVSHRIPRNEFDRSPDNGLRLASYSDADSIIVRLSRRAQLSTPPDYNLFKAVSDAEFDAFRRMYDYDAQQLDTKLEAEGEVDEYRWQKVTFTAAYPGPRMAAYLLIPKQFSPPFEPIIFWPAGNALNERRLDPEEQILRMLIGFLPRSGRVVVLPLLLDTYERSSGTGPRIASRTDTTTRYRDIAVQWVKDVKRTIDFLETRSDMRSDRIGLVGASWGGALGPLVLAVDPRIKAAVLNSAGYMTPRVRAEVAVANYTPRVHQPTLVLNGQYDTVIPYETSQRPFFAHLGTPPEHKKRVTSPNGHILPIEEGMRESLAWFDRYLSRKTASN